MGSVSDQKSGTASGINNAISKIASVFANAILGAVAVLIFTNGMQEKINRMPNLNSKQKQEIMVQSADLGNAKPPKNIPDPQIVNGAYHDSYISAYVVIMRLSAGSALLSALIAALFIKKKHAQ